MTRTRTNPSLALFLLVAWALALAPGWGVPPAQYRQALREHPAQVVISQAELAQAQVAKPAAALEVRGQVTGVMSCGDSLVVQLRLADGQAFHFGAASRVPELQMGARLRVLVTPEPGRAGSYQLLAAGWEQVLAAGDPKGTAATSANTRAGERARPYPSRGAGVDNIDRSILAAYQQAVRYFNRRLSDQESLRIAANIINNSAALGVDARLVMAVVAVESGFNPNATSPKGAMGLGQLMPTTARGLGVRDAYDPEQNLSASVRLIGNHLSNTGDISLALACYNAGAGAVRRYGGVPPYRETINYVRKVTSLYYRLAPEMRP